ncbi:hypothetical protein [Streptomyces sp. TLI_105]|uniref:hypothetical protein n=1 Tax=Streptomyces sp. TLI_105 TaxID=1881019 RepID=UPI0008998881|nr:hypothetical protein [Streptomyces sp. TLI_105]SED61031.1 hypothetical protein SAMN05428939_5676 [Streptomyces sp. TLI_105]
MTRPRLRPVGAALAAALAGCALALSAGCGRAPDPRPAPSPAPRTSTPADVCANLVSYWVKEALRGSTWAGLDWEQKGLSNEQYEIHDEVLAAARAEERRAGRKAAEALADRESRRRCEAAKGATGSSENWRPPDEWTTTPTPSGTSGASPGE